MIDAVEMRPAFAWDCPECGREHFCRAVVAELSREELLEMKAEFGVEPWESGHFLTKPDRVHCPDCNISFDTADFAVDVEGQEQ